MRVHKDFEPVTDVHKTTNYKSLIKVAGNRKIKPHLKKIIESMKKNGNKSLGLVGVVVEENGEAVYYILDGQHRVVACEELGIPFEFKLIEIKDLSEVMTLISDLNTSSGKWNGNDFLQGWIDYGKENYVRFHELRESCKWVENKENKAGKNVTKKKKIDITILMAIFEVNKTQFEDGSMVLKHYKQNKEVLDNLMELIHHVPTNCQPLRAVIRTLKKDEYNHARMSNIIKSFKGAFSNDEKAVETKMNCILTNPKMYEL